VCIRMPYSWACAVTGPNSQSACFPLRSLIHLYPTDRIFIDRNPHSLTLVVASPHRMPAPLRLAAARRFCCHAAPTPPTEPRRRRHGRRVRRLRRRGGRQNDFVRDLINADLPGGNSTSTCGSSWPTCPRCSGTSSKQQGDMA